MNESRSTLAPMTEAPARSLAYRPELDGLRALAVLAVIFYHFGIPPFRGGFIGVDIFFVISGFLISGILRQQIEGGTFSFVQFYVRRFRRLIPASIAVIAVTSLLALLLFSPEMLAGHGKLSVMSAFSLANRELYFASGYFDPSAATKPLLHMWSLSVEEQFYFVWPAFMLLCLRFLGKRITPWVVAAVSVVSLAFCVDLTQRLPQAAFYLTPYRMFEFGFGALLLWLPLSLERRFGQVTGLVGLAGLLVMACVLSDGSSFPGWNAVGVALLSAALIHGSRTGVVHRLLSHPAAVGLGVLSYSLYLTHWPVYVFYRFIVERDLGVADQALLLGLTAASALALYHGVERPFRLGRRAHKDRTRRPARLYPVAALYALVIGAGALALTTDGLPDRARVNGVVAPTSDTLERAQARFCQGKDPQPPITCATSEDRPRSVYVWGDSHAKHLAPGLAGALPQQNVKIIFTSACVPLWGVSELPYARSRTSRRACAQRNMDALKFLESLPPAPVIIAARWKNYLTTPELRRIGLQGLKDVTARLERSGHPVTVIGNVIEPGPEVIDCLRSPDTAITPRARCRPFGSATRASLEANAALRALGPVFFDPTPVFCTPACQVAAGQTMLFRDGHHLSDEGSRRLAGALVRAAPLVVGHQVGGAGR
ncbi:acyltransferase [Deinococcus aerolatus]|uniref:Acyltransferase n=1 Tax=Deinococcus aerolatus TaxID=522487 RepID=A0ABQ2GFJ5_9DEIO|nr:acyltransferase family protein [Deinococcus aerolatus]GGL93404.1 acyltransferase [Deinococcus aerolatus]